MIPAVVITLSVIGAATVAYLVRSRLVMPWEKSQRPTPHEDWKRRLDNLPPAPAIRGYYDDHDEWTAMLRADNEAMRRRGLEAIMRTAQADLRARRRATKES